MKKPKYKITLGPFTDEKDGLERTLEKDLILFPQGSGSDYMGDHNPLVGDFNIILDNPSISYLVAKNQLAKGQHNAHVVDFYDQQRNPYDRETNTDEDTDRLHVLPAE